MRIPLFRIIVSLYPRLADKLIQAGISEKPEKFIKKSFFVSFYVTTLVIVLLGLLLTKFNVGIWFLTVLFPVILYILLTAFVKRPDAILKKKQNEFDREIVFSGKFLVIELESGVPIYDAMRSITKSYPVIGKYFREILNRVDIGTPLEEAIDESIELTPSQNFRKILWQVYNSLKTGSDLAPALNLTLEQISADQLVQANEYGKKLNPIVMFYMVAGVIFPSIGIIMVIVFSSFFSIKITLTALLLVAFLVAIMQIMFLMIIKGSRPSVGFS